MSDDKAAQDILNVRNDLAQTFNEALKTYGPATAMAAVTIFAAAAVHQAEHLSDNPYARQIVLGQWDAQFHAHLCYLEEQCDAQTDFIARPPAGQA
jgi:hypothetical protein